MKPKPVTLEYIRTPRLWDADRAPIGIPCALWMKSMRSDEDEQVARYLSDMALAIAREEARKAARKAALTHHKDAA